MENLLPKSICYCKVCISLNSKGLIPLFSNPIDEIKTHIELHCRQLIFDNNDQMSEDKSVTFIVKKSIDQNQWIFTIEKESRSQRLVIFQQSIKIEPNADQFNVPISPVTTENRIQKSKIRKRNPKFRKKPSIISSHCTTVLADKINENGQAYCVKCNQYVKVISGTTKHLQVYDAIRHAQRHSTKFLYKCDQCQLCAKTDSEIQSHLRNKHKIRCYAPDIEDYKLLSSIKQDEILDLITSCFGQRKSSETQVAQKRLSKLPENADPITEYIHKLFKNRRLEDGAECGLCGKSFVVIEKKIFSYRYLLPHATAHMDKCIFDCKLCDHKKHTKEAIVLHLSKKHDIHSSDSSKYYIDLRPDHKEEIIQMIEKCFGQTDSVCDPKAAKFYAQIKTRIGKNQLLFTRQTYCRQLTQGASNIHCHLCSKSLLLPFTVKKSSSRALIHHVEAIHLQKLLYRCRLCGKEIIYYGDIAKHMKKEHGTFKASGQYDNFSNDHHLEIMDLLRKCFEKRMENQESSYSQTVMECNRNQTITKENIIENRLLSYRKSYCLRLNRGLKHTNCQLCSRSFSFKSGLTSKPLIGHVATHLKKPLYRCRLCSKSILSYRSLDFHMNKKHDIRKIAGNYDNLSNKYHHRIMDLLKKCFEKRKKDRSFSKIRKASTIALKIKSKENSLLWKKYLKKVRKAKMVANKIGN